MFRINCIFAPTNQNIYNLRIYNFPTFHLYENPYFNPLTLSCVHVPFG